MQQELQHALMNTKDDGQHQIQCIRAETMVAQTMVAPRMTAYKLRLHGYKQSQRFALAPDAEGNGVLLTRNTADPSECLTTSLQFNLPLNINEPVGITSGWNSDMFIGTAMNPDHLHLTPNGGFTVNALKPDIVFASPEQEWSLVERITRIEENLARLSKSQVRVIGLNGESSHLTLNDADIGSYIINTKASDVVVTLPDNAMIGGVITLVQAGSGSIVINCTEILAPGGTTKTERLGDVVKVIALPSSQNVTSTKWMMIR
jgi:hypothetical protein